MVKNLRIAAAQFPVSHDMVKNFKYIKKLILKAAENKVEVVHFPETALPGYLSFPNGRPDAFDWKTLDSLTSEIRRLAHLYDIWLILGTTCKNAGQLPFNSICVISNKGRIKGYYNKQRLYEKEPGFYSQGQTPLVVTLKGYKCGFLICYDNCFPELYQRYRELGVRLLFHSFHNAGNRQRTSIADLMAANLLVRSADYQMWISSANSSQPYSPCPATIARPDGSANKARRHVTGMVIEDFPEAKIGWTYDNTKIR